MRARVKCPGHRPAHLAHAHAAHPGRNHHNTVRHQQRQTRNNTKHDRTPPANRLRLHLRHSIRRIFSAGGKPNQLPAMLEHPPQVIQRDGECGGQQQHPRGDQQILQRKHFRSPYPFRSVLPLVTDCRATACFTLGRSPLGYVRDPPSKWGSGRLGGSFPPGETRRKNNRTRPPNSSSSSSNPHETLSSIAPTTLSASANTSMAFLISSRA
jgi:hypothetical protein